MSGAERPPPPFALLYLLLRPNAELNAELGRGSPLDSTPDP